MKRKIIYIHTILLGLQVYLIYQICLRFSELSHFDPWSKLNIYPLYLTSLIFLLSLFMSYFYRKKNNFKWLHYLSSFHLLIMVLSIVFFIVIENKEIKESADFRKSISYLIKDIDYYISKHGRSPKNTKSFSNRSIIYKKKLIHIKYIKVDNTNYTLEYQINWYKYYFSSKLKKWSIED